MLLHDMQIELNQDYTIYFKPTSSEVEVTLYDKDDEIARAQLVTDSVDVICVTQLQMDAGYVHRLIDDEHELGDAFVKTLIKFPCLVRKPEFIFVMDVPDHLKVFFDKRKFNQQSEAQIKDGILIRKDSVLPAVCKPVQENIKIQDSIEPSMYPAILNLLKTNAYWQKNLTLERLALLIEHSMCFMVCCGGDVIGFARVLTDKRSFASLWDVVVATSYQGRGIGTALMHHVFSSPQLYSISNWILFTDTAKSLYQKFGFVAEEDMPERRLVYKLRLQEHCPEYMTGLIKEMPVNFPYHLNCGQSVALLFGQYRKRATTSDFLLDGRRAIIVVGGRE